MDDTEKRVMDNYSHSRYSYWNALITLNGIFLIVFSVIIISKMEGINIFFYGVIILSMISLWLLLLNFRVNKKFHYEQGKISPTDFNELSEEDKNILQENSINKNVKRYNSINRREIFIEIFFFFETLFIIAIIYCNR